MSERAERLVPPRPTLGDVDALYEIYSDHRVWTHFADPRFNDRVQAEGTVWRSLQGGKQSGSGQRLVRATGQVLPDRV